MKSHKSCRFLWTCFCRFKRHFKLKQLQLDWFLMNFNMTTDLVFGGLVSLSGIHLTARGYALMANEFLEQIDATYGSNFGASGSMLKQVIMLLFYPENLPN